MLIEFRRLVPAQGAVAALHQVVHMVCSLVVLRWVAPAENGIWQAMLVLESYLLVVRLGVSNSMNRQYPFLLGQGEKIRAVQMVQGAQAYTFLAGLLEILGVGMAVFFLPGGVDWHLAVATLVIYAPATLYRGFLEATFRGGQEFKALARVQAWQIFASIATIPLVYGWGFPGYLGRTALLAVFAAVVLHAVRPVRVPFHWDRAIIWLLMVTGLPLFLSNYGISVAGTFGRVLLLEYGGAHQLGLFTPVAALLTLGVLLPSIVSTYVLPRLNFDLGRKGDAAAVARSAWQVGLVCALILMPGVAVGWFVLPGLLQSLLPAYAESAGAMRWGLLLCVTGCLRVAILPFSVLQAWTPMFVYVSALLLTNLALPALALAHLECSPVESVTLGLLVASMVQVAVGASCVRWAVARTSGRQVT